MITIEQIKAARALLDWTQDDLAKAANLSKPMINTLERRIANPKLETLDAIRTACERAGVEFTQGPGVKLNATIVKTEIFEGEDSLMRLLNDIFDTLHNTDQTLMISGIAEDKYKNWGGDRVLKQVEKRIKHGIKTKLLSCDGDMNFIEPIEHYRWMPKEFFPKVPTYIYGDKYAIFLWGPPKKVILIENAEIAQSFKDQFDAFWKNATTPKLK